ncbi:hypothetical protein EGR_06965 [Echinococcus granulosus]|uniref:Uncharacterized protein n=1 Tax=Echinococcus granulosus TaxID=6210 RepID=W6UC67_ECHGR|nr:hypothetical protein EGR_06965 [Echinococcus granulosus]EUB58221.1 hypothetical protein EGR_06965 [Echinococcus granulosus]
MTTAYDLRRDYNALIPSNQEDLLFFEKTSSSASTPVVTEVMCFDTAELKRKMLDTMPV